MKHSLEVSTDEFKLSLEFTERPIYKLWDDEEFSGVTGVIDEWKFNGVVVKDPKKLLLAIAEAIAQLQEAQTTALMGRPAKEQFDKVLEEHVNHS